MPDDRVHDEPYEPPRIEERAEIDIPLIGATSGTQPCALFSRN